MQQGDVSGSDGMQVGTRHSVRVPWTLAIEATHRRKRSLASPLTLFGGFAVVILVGAALLLLPVSAAPGRTTSLLDALFTATSAVCVTGLVVLDTGTHWSLFGQAVVLVLIQVGGFGFMTSATLLFLVLRQRIGLRERLLVGESIGIAAPGGLVRLIRNMAFVALTIEGLGVLALLSRFSAGENPGRGVWMAVFHAVSSFNNAGFDLFGGFTSLTGWRTDAVMVTVTAVLLISGGLSYVVLADVWRHKRFARLSLDSKLVLVVSGALLLSGTVVYLIAEGGNPATLGMVTLPHRMLDAVFQSATRTAGFTTVNVNSLNDHTLLFTIILMFIGGAAGSTAGGIKVNTFGILVATVISTLRGRSQAIAFGREFSVQQVRRALTVAVLALTFVVVVSLTLAVTEDADILTVMFEATSAFGTVGLSMGLTPHLSVTGRLVVITAMFVGRLGPLSVALALMQRQRRREYGYPGEPVRIG